MRGVPLRVVALFAVIIPTLLALTAYVARRSAEAAGLDGRRRRILVGSLWAVVALPFVLRMVGGLEVARSASLVGFGVGLACLIAIGFLVPVDVISWMASRWARPGARAAASGTGSVSGTASETETGAAVVAEPQAAAVGVVFTTLPRGGRAGPP